MSQEELFINGELLRLRREARGWVLNDMATRACMSVKQIRQLEEGGMSSFYSVAVKVTAAKKVGALLGLSAEEVFAQNADPIVVEASMEPEALIAEVVTELVTASDAEDAPVAAAQVESKPEPIKPVAVESSESPESKDETPNSKNTLWLTVALLGVALAVGTYFQPHEEPVAEPAPPIQVLPADAIDPASAASAADAPASGAEVVAAPVSVASVPATVPQKPASTPALNSTSVVPVASAARVIGPAASGASVIRAAGSSVVAAPSAPTASKAP
jgi:transcriptional regulator with XRE-family HTH domain